MWKEGLRYRKQYKRLPGRPDFVFVSARVAVFCDSSFWHGRHWETRRDDFKSNRDFWWPKIERNIARDLFVNAELEQLGWAVLRFWDDDISRAPDKCARKVHQVVKRRLVDCNV